MLSDYAKPLIWPATERPVQQFLSEHPEVLAAALLRGHTRCVRPQVRLGAEYVADFLVADVSSIAVEWRLIELESPRAPMFLRSTGEYAEKPRHALHQIASWRAWLDDNRGYAGRPKPGGLGLIGISSRAAGLVLVGRRGLPASPQDEQWLRRSTQIKQGISVHSYDWLLDRVDDCAR